MALNATLVKSTGVAALGGLLFGFDTAVISGTTQSLTQVYHLTPYLLGVTVFSAMLGTIFGSMFAGIPGDKYGRRDSLRVLAILYLVSALGCAFAWNWYGARLLPLYRRPRHRRLVGTGPDVHRRTRSRQISRPPGRTFPVQRRPRHPARLFFELSRRPCSISAPTNGAGSSPSPPLPAAVVLRVALRHSAQPALAGQSKDASMKPAKCCKQIGEDELRDRSSRRSSTRSTPNSAASDELFSWKYRFPIFLAVTIGMFNQLQRHQRDPLLHQRHFRGRRLQQSLRRSPVRGHRRHKSFFTMLAMSVIDKIGRKTLLLIGSVGTAFCLGGVAYIFFAHQHQSLARLAPRRLHRLLRVFPRRRDLGLHRRSFPQSGPRQRAEPRQLLALVHERRDLARLPGHRRTPAALIRSSFSP